jgi:exoribonuclease-2
MEAQLRTQDALAQQLRARRHALGSLDLETFQPRALFKGEQVVDIRQQVQNRARQLIEEVMMATNGCTARYLAGTGRRLAAPRGALARALAAHRGGGGKDYGEELPDEPGLKALEAFLAEAAPARPAALSRPVAGHRQAHGPRRIRGRAPGGAPIGHFGLAVRDYTHSTAPSCVDQAVDLGLLADERRRQLDGVAAVAHVKALLPAVHRDLVRALGRLAGQRRRW